MGDYSKAKREFSSKPKVKFEELVKIMVKADWGKVKVKGYSRVGIWGLSADCEN